MIRNDGLSILSYSTRPGYYSYLPPGTQIRYFSTGLEDSVLSVSKCQYSRNGRRLQRLENRKVGIGARKQERRARER